MSFFIDSEAWIQASGCQVAMDTMSSLQFGVLPALSSGEFELMNYYVGTIIVTSCKITDTKNLVKS